MTEKDEILELYRMMVDTVTANEQRRQQISSVFITLIAAGFAAAGAVKDFNLIYVTAPAALVSMVWWAQVRYLKKLATAKFYVIDELETKLNYRPFREEWLFLKRNSDEEGEKRSWFRLGLAEMEMIVPLAIFVGCFGHIGFVLYNLLQSVCA